MLFIGIDLGTSAVKLLLMDETGRIRNSVSRPCAVSYPRPGWSEQNPEDWYRVTMEGLHALLADCDRRQVRGLSVGGQMHGLVALDRQGQVIRPAILWNDGRSEAEVRFLNEEIGRDRLTAWTGNIAYAGFTAPKLLWMRQHEPENFAEIHKILLPKDYLLWRLTGEYVTDPSDASGTLYYDVAGKCWSAPMLALLQISEEQLPRVCESSAAAGTLRPEIARELGLGQVTAAAGAGDNAAAAVGTGTVGAGSCNISLGTSGTIFLPLDRFAVDPHNALHAFAHADGGYHLMGCMLSAASCGKWWVEDILQTQDYGRELTETDSSVFFLPYLMGERSPLNDAAARGVFFGLSMDTTRQQLTRAVYEGVTFGLRQCMEAARTMGAAPAQTTLCGGGARSPVWQQLCADILGIPVLLPESEEGPAGGAAMLAMCACGLYPDVQAAAAALCRTRARILPDFARVRMYDEKYEKWKQIYPAVRELYRVIC